MEQRLHVVEHRSVGDLLEVRVALGLVGLDPGIPFGIEDADSDIDDVGACIAVFRQLGTVAVHIRDDLVVCLGNTAAGGDETRNLQVAMRDGVGEDCLI